jgi:CRP-like cAMP-binding protein
VPADGRDLVLTDSERRLALRGIVGFDRLAAEELAAIAQHARLRRFAAGATLERTGEERATVHVLVSGALAIERGGRAWPTPFAPPVLDLFWLARDSMPLTITTPEGALTLELPTDELEEVLDEHFSIWLATVRALASWLLELRERAPASRGVRRHAGKSRRMPAFTERLSILGDGLALAGGHLETLARLAESAGEIHVAAGRALWTAGDAARSIVVPIEGALAGAPDDEPGALGMLEILAERPRASTVEVVEPLVALAVDRESFLDVLEDHHEHARDVLALLAAAIIRRLE